MRQLRLFAVSLAIILGALIASSPARAQPVPGMPANCDADVFRSMATQAQYGFNNMSRMTTTMLRPPTATLASWCQRMVSSVWNPNRFIREAQMILLGAGLPYTYMFTGNIGFSASFNPINMIINGLLPQIEEKIGINNICPDANSDLGNALRMIKFNPTTGAVEISGRPAVNQINKLFGLKIFNDAKINFNIKDAEHLKQVNNELD
jgi:hypothetical protein